MDPLCLKPLLHSANASYTLTSHIQILIHVYCMAPLFLSDLNLLVKTGGARLKHKVLGLEKQPETGSTTWTVATGQAENPPWLLSLVLPFP